MKTFTISLIWPLALGMCIVQLMSQPMKAQSNTAPSACVLGNLNAPYGLHLSGWTSATGPTLPVTTLGRIIFDGNGGITGSITYVLNGTASQGETISGIYVMNPDCTGHVTLTPANGNNIDHLNFVWVGQGSTVYFIQTDAGTTVNGAANMQP